MSANDGLDQFEKWSSPRHAFSLLKKLSMGRPCDLSGIEDFDHIQQAGGIQWPYPQGELQKSNNRRLFENGIFYHPDGKARFGYTPVQPPPEETNTDFPFILITGRGSVAQWHTQTRTGKVEKLQPLYPSEPYVELNSQDAASLGISAGDMVEVSSKRAAVKVQVKLNDRMQSGQSFMAMHYQETNLLTKPYFDPVSREPSYKYSAVNIIKA